jgi:hypothetical protein
MIANPKRRRALNARRERLRSTIRAHRKFQHAGEYDCFVCLPLVKLQHRLRREAAA